MPRFGTVDQRSGRASSDLAELVQRALANDQQAWRSLVDGLKGVAWKVLYSFNMGDDDRKDAFASTFFRLYENLATIRDVAKLPGWVATTARNEARTTLRKRAKLIPTGDLDLHHVVTDDHPDEHLLDNELLVALRAAFRRLPGDAQALLRLLCADPPVGYDAISELLHIPRGSIGPTRQRCLERLRRSPELASFLHGGAS